jgi:hypothetical protein
MSKKRCYGLLVRLTGLAAVLALGFVGCETVDTNTGITLTPASANLTGVGAATTFTAAATDPTRVLLPPLVWTASNPEIGDVTGRGLTGAYVSRGVPGSNVITVRDQGGAEGIAVVTQQAAP